MSATPDPASLVLAHREAKRTTRRKPAKVSPTARALAYCRKLNWTAEVVERWNPHARVRHDLFGFVDIVAVDEDGRVRWLQVTVTDSMTTRIAKIEGDGKMRAIAGALGSAGSVEVWGWAKRGARGKRKTWTLRRALRVAGEWYDYPNGDEMIWPTNTGAAHRGEEQA